MTRQLVSLALLAVVFQSRVVAADDVILYVDHAASTARIKACVEKTGPWCTGTSLWSNESQVVTTNSAGAQRTVTIQECLLLWRACEGDPANVVQQQASIASSVILDKLGKMIGDLSTTLTNRFKESLDAQEARFGLMMRKLGLDEPKPAAKK